MSEANAHINDLHNTAMFLAEQAQEFTRRACKLEEQAALRAYEEPSRSVLFRSAAELALAADWPAKSALLAKEGLRGTPPNEIKKELRGVLSRAEAITATR